MRPMAWRRRGEVAARIPRRGELRIGIFGVSGFHEERVACIR